MTNEMIEIDFDTALERKLQPCKGGAIYLGEGDHLIEFTTGEVLVTSDFTGDSIYKQLKKGKQ
jgi:hypothetical protein